MGFFKKKQPAAASIPVHGPVEFIICGLGNPGSKYGNTRHNIGFCALDVLAKDCGAAVERSRFHAMTGEAMLDGRHILLMKPATYMNLSGQAVQEAMRFYKLPPERLIVLSDDISLPVGKMRIRTKGSAGATMASRISSSSWAVIISPALNLAWGPNRTRNMTWPIGCWDNLPKRRAKPCIPCCKIPPKPAPSSCRASRRKP